MIAFRPSLKTFLLFFFVLLGFANLHGKTIIKEITFTGLKRTKESVLFKIIKPVEVGSLFTDETEDMITQKIRGAKIFVPDTIAINTNVVNDEAFINVEVQDRWTFIPVPLFSISKDKVWRAGVLTLESNLFGSYKTLGLGFFFGTDGWSFLSFFSDPIFLGSELIFTSGIAGGFERYIDANVSEVEIRNYKTVKVVGTAGLSHPLTPVFSIGGDIKYDLFLLERLTLGPDVKDINSFGLGMNFKWKDIYYDIPYENGIDFNISPSVQWDFNSKTIQPQIKGSFLWSFKPWLTHLISFSGKAGGGIIPTVKQFRLGGVNGSFVLPSKKIAADEFVNFTASYNLPVWIFRGGAISFKVFYEAGYYKSDIVKRTFYHGPAAGLEFYINNLAIPAIGINIGWNLETGRMQFFGGIGTNPNE